jgi:transcription initiation factor TFIIB
MSLSAPAPRGNVPYDHNLNVTLLCKECKEYPPNLVEEFSSGDLVCGSCGIVVGDRIVDTRSEWRTFSNDDQGGDDPSRVGDGANPLLNGSQLETTIGGTGDARSRELARAQNKVTHDKSTKTLLAAYKEIGAFCDSINIQKVVSDAAKQLFKLVDDSKAFKGKSQEAIIAGCILIACRQCGVHRTFREIYALTKVPKKEIGRVFKQLEKFFAEQHHQRMEEISAQGKSASAQMDYKHTTSTTAHDLINRFWNHLNLPQSGTAIGQELAETAASLGTLAGRSPISSAAACIYMASHFIGQGRSPKLISQVAGVSDGTIRNAYKHLYEEREKLINKKWIENGKGKMSALPTS